MAKRGRPRLPAELRKTEQVRVVLTVGEYEALLTFAESSEKTMSAVARELVIDCLQKEGVLNG
jgi:hypothetical protein